MDTSKKRILIVFAAISIALLMVLGAVLKLQLFPNPKTVEMATAQKVVTAIHRALLVVGS